MTWTGIMQSDFIMNSLWHTLSFQLLLGERRCSFGRDKISIFGVKTIFSIKTLR